MTEPVLAHPTRDGEFILDTDASNHSIGGALYQMQDGEERLIAYASKTLTDTQRNYCTTKRELLAVIRMVKLFRHYLWGTKFLVRTDHASLTWLLRFKDADGMLARWLAELAPYQITVGYREGKNHLNADGLSRRRCRGCPRPDCPDKESPHPESLCSSSTDGELDPFPSSGTPTTTLSALPAFVTKVQTGPGGGDVDKVKLGSYTVDELLELQTNDSDIVPVLRWKKELSTKPDEAIAARESSETQTLIANWHRLIIDDNGLLVMKAQDPEPNRVVAPKCIRLEILHLCHDNVLSGHVGVKRTRQRIRKRWYWPCYMTDIARYVMSCTICTCRSGNLPNRISPLRKQLIGVPFQRIGMDILDVHHISKRGNRYIIVISDYFSKWCIAVARKNHKAITCSEVIINQFVCQFGVPMQILTDQGREFEGQLFQEVCRLLRIHKIRTSPYRPQTDGLVERQNRTLLEMLSKYVRYQYSDWVDHLPFLVMAYNTSVHDSTGCTPFSLIYGREALLPIDLVYPPINLEPFHFKSGSEYVEFLKQTISETHTIARKNLQQSALRQARNYDVRARSKPEFKPGDLVRYYYVREKAGNKFHRCFIGPYRVVSRESDMNYKICGKLKDSGREDTRVVHADHLIRFEPDRSVLFPRYGPVPDSPDDKIQSSHKPYQPHEGVKTDIFASESPDDEIDLLSNITPPSFRAPDELNKSLITPVQQGKPTLISDSERKIPDIGGGTVDRSATQQARSRSGQTLISPVSDSSSSSEPDTHITKLRYPSRVRKKPDRWEYK